MPDLAPKAEPAAALLILSGAFDSSLTEFTQSHSLIVCADGGAEHARAIGLMPTAIVGDLDSISASTLNYYEARGTAIIRTPDQERDDFEKALAYLASQHSGAVVVLGLTGLRTDHAITNLSVMLRWSDAFEELIAYDQYASYRFLTSKYKTIEYPSRIGQLISLMPFGTARNVTTSNLLYALNSEDLSLGSREGLSNVSTGSPVTISIEEGALLVIVSN